MFVWGFCWACLGLCWTCHCPKPWKTNCFLRFFEIQDVRFFGLLNSILVYLGALLGQPCATGVFTCTDLWSQNGTKKCHFSAHLSICSYTFLCFKQLCLRSSTYSFANHNRVFKKIKSSHLRTKTPSFRFRASRWRPSRGTGPRRSRCRQRSWPGESWTRRILVKNQAWVKQRATIDKLS